jgi:putative aldouronate transport system permease protein
LSEPLAIHAAHPGGGKKKKSFFALLWEQRHLVILSTPFILLVVMFTFVPLWGWALAFMNYSVAKGIFASSFAGFSNFIDAFSNPDYWSSLRNTFIISILKMITSYFFTILLALTLNEVRIILFKRVVQTISYLPYFVSWVVAANIVYGVLSPTRGIVNIILKSLGIVEQGIPFMGMPSLFWIIVALSNVWKNVGYGAIIYLSAMTSIDPEQYEAASIDGAGRLKRIRHITLPGIMPMVRILLILSLGNIINAGFEQVYLLRNPMVDPMARTIEVYVYDYALRYLRFSYGTAIGMTNSLISLILVLSANYVSKKVSGEGII